MSELTYQDQLDLMKKWERYLPPDANPIYWFFLAQLLENQSTLLAAYESHGCGVIKDAIGEETDLKRTFFQAMSHAWQASYLPLMVGVQTLQAPTSTIDYISTTVTPPAGASNPTLHMRRQKLPVKVEIRSSRYGRFSAPTLLDRLAHASVNDNHTYATFRKVFDGILLETSRRVLGVAWLVASAGGRVRHVSVDEFPDAIPRAIRHVHKYSMAGPANNLIGNHESLSWLGLSGSSSMPASGIYKHYKTLYEGIQNIFVDDSFPESAILLWHKGHAPDDSGIIYSPFNHPIIALRAKPFSELTINIRDKITVTHADRFFIVELGLLDRLARSVT